MQFKDKVVTVLNFTALLIEHSYARHIYNSTEVSIVCVVYYSTGMLHYGMLVFVTRAFKSSANALVD